MTPASNCPQSSQSINNNKYSCLVRKTFTPLIIYCLYSQFHQLKNKSSDSSQVNFCGEHDYFVSSPLPDSVSSSSFLFRSGGDCAEGSCVRIRLLSVPAAAPKAAPPVTP